MTPGRRLILLALVAGLAVAAAGVAAALLGGSGRQVATGVVVTVEATSLTDLQAFSIRTTEGATIAFRVERLENPTEFPPAHLNEHRATAQPIRVTYRDDPAGPVALRIEDAATP